MAAASRSSHFNPAADHATTDIEDLAVHLARTSSLSLSQAQRLIDEVLNFFSDTPEDFVRHRHRALQARGLNNAEIFERIAQELKTLRFSAPIFSERQLRRIVYG